MGGKNIVQSFSYNLRDAESIDACFKMAKEDGISFSEFVVSLLKEEARKKVVGPETNPLNIIYHKQTEKPLQPVTLDDWMDKIKAITEPDEAGRIEGFHKSVMLAARDQFYELKARRILKK